MPLKRRIPSNLKLQLDFPFLSCIICIYTFYNLFIVSIFTSVWTNSSLFIEGNHEPVMSAFHQYLS